MSTLKKLIEESTDHDDAMVRRLWNEGKNVELGKDAQVFLNTVIEKLGTWLTNWEDSQESIKAELTSLKKQAILDLKIAIVPETINQEMLEKGYMLAIAGQIAKDKKIVALLTGNTNRKNWPQIIKFIQSGDEELKKSIEDKKKREDMIIEDPIARVKNEIQRVAAGEQIVLAKEKIDSYTKEKGLLAANNVLYALKKLGGSSTTSLTTDQSTELKEFLAEHLKLLHDNFESLDEDIAASLSKFFRTNSSLISKAIENIPKSPRFKLPSTKTKNDTQDLFDKCKQKANTKPALELALLHIEAGKLNDPAIDQTKFFQRSEETGLIGRANIQKWKEQPKKDTAIISNQIMQTGKLQFGDNFFNQSKLVLEYALFLNQAAKNPDDPDLINKMKKLPVIGFDENKNWANASNNAQKAVILGRINKRATEFFGAELLTAAKGVVREKQSVQKTSTSTPVKWTEARPNKEKRESVVMKRNSQRGIEH